METMMHFIFQDSLMNRKHLFIQKPYVILYISVILISLMCHLLNKNVNSEMFLTGSSRC